MTDYYLQLTRLQTSGLTIGMLLITRWVAHGVDLVDTIVLTVAGLLIHMGFFSMNEWADRDHDRGHPHKVNPITAGHILPREALSLSLATLTLSIVLIGAWAWSSLTWSWTSLPLFSSYVMGTSYNMRGKRFPRLAPWILGGWAFLLSLWVAGLSGFPLRALWLPWAWGFMLVLQVLEGGLKDWVHDGRPPGGLDRHMSYMEYVQLAFIAAIGVGVAIDSWGPGAVILAAAMSAACYEVLIRVKQTWRFRKRTLKLMGIHNMVEYLTVVVVCLAWVSPVHLILAFIVPILMYGGFNRAAYGRAAAPAI